MGVSGYGSGVSHSYLSSSGLLSAWYQREFSHLCVDSHVDVVRAGADVVSELDQVSLDRQPCSV